MGCFEQLVKSKFLANVSKELRMARQVLHSMSQTHFPAIVPGTVEERKDLYKEYVYHYFLDKEIKESLSEDDDPVNIFYVQLDHIVFIFSLRKDQVTEAVTYNYNVSGFIPLYTGKHYYGGYTIHTALIDTRISFIPPSMS